MVFSSRVFLFFFLPALLTAYYAIKNKSVRNYILLLASLFFYAWGEPVFVFIMLFSIALNYFLTLIMAMAESLHKKFWLSIAIIFDVLVLGVFKYSGFILENFSALTHIPTPQVHIALPIGISFFTFQMMSYVFDVYYGKSKAQKNFFYVALYIAFFPQLIAGPIVRYNQIESEIENRHENFDDFSEGVRRFIYGLGKKVLLANFIAQIADNTFGYLIDTNISVILSWFGAIAYTLQVYFDFSGYSDMAIGLGLMFGFHFAENFNYPYIAKSISDYWQRWHISLTSWFRDYVYMPRSLAQLKARPLKTYPAQERQKAAYRLWLKNSLLVWLLTGIWHGADWTYIFWGLFYFVVLAIENKFKFVSKLKYFAHVYVMFIVLIAHVIYRSSSITNAVRYLASMFALRGNVFCDGGFFEYVRGSWVMMIFAVVCSMPVSKIFERHRTAESIWLAVVFTISALEILSSGYNPFIYFNF